MPRVSLISWSQCNSWMIWTVHCEFKDYKLAYMQTAFCTRLAGERANIWVKEYSFYLWQLSASSYPWLILKKAKKKTPNVWKCGESEPIQAHIGLKAGTKPGCVTVTEQTVSHWPIGSPDSSACLTCMCVICEETDHKEKTDRQKEWHLFCWMPLCNLFLSFFLWKNEIKIKLHKWLIHVGFHCITAVFQNATIWRTVVCVLAYIITLNSEEL